jgi:hypothetical protein
MLSTSTPQASPNPGGGAVVTVFGRTGAIVPAGGDYTDGQITSAATAVNYAPVSPDVSGNLAGIDTALGLISDSGLVYAVAL